MELEKSKEETSLVKTGASSIMNALDQNKYDVVERVFQTDRDSITSEVVWCINNMRDVKFLNDVMIKALSRRQSLIEDNHILLDCMIKLNRKMRDLRFKEYDTRLNQVQYRLKNKDERETMAEGVTSYLQEQIDILNNQIQFYKSTIDTIDNIYYGIKHRMDLEKLIGVTG